MNGAALPPGTEGIRFARPTAAAADSAAPIDQSKKKAALTPPREGLVRELYKKSAQPIWTPSFSVAFRLIVLIRVWSAMYTSVTADCDEVYNYWEALHFLLKGDGFRTWEYSSKYAIRSWAYILIHAAPAKLFSHINPSEKRLPFFTVRLALAILSTLCEARFYRSIADNVSLRIGRYTLFFLILNAGMYTSATTFLPSSFSMHFVMLAFSFTMEPVSADRLPAIKAVLCFSVAALVGWPFSILLALPFVLEQLHLSGQQTSRSVTQRFSRLAQGGLWGLAILAAVCAIDSFFYGRLVIVPWNIISYNLFSKAGGPKLYGTEPWYYYLLNGALNANILLPLALLSVPAVLLTAALEPKRLLITKPGQSSAAILLAMRALPFYIWFGILSVQPHKEERFMFPAFPLICSNAALTLGLVRGAMEALYVKVTRAPFRAARTPIFRYATSAVIVLTSFLSMARILAQDHYFRAPMPLLFHFQYTELPRLALYNYPSAYPKLNLKNYQDAEEQFDLSPLQGMNLTLCYGGEWYRFPGSFLVPNQIRTEFVKSGFDGQLPKHFVEQRKDVNSVKRSFRRKLQITSASPQGYNELNREEPDRYVALSSCDYLVDLDFPHRYAGDGGLLNQAPPRYAVDSSNWHRVHCSSFLDSENSPRLTRSLYLPFVKDRNSYGDYCLLRSAKVNAPAAEI